MKKLLAIALTVLMLTVCLAACANNLGDPDAIGNYTPAVNYITTANGSTFTFKEAPGDTAILIGYVGKAIADDHVEIPGDFYGRKVVGIDKQVFRNLAAVVEVTIPETVTSIGDYAFAGCTELTAIKLPAALEKIGEGAFQGCDKLASVDFGKALISIDKFAFQDCVALTQVDLPDTLEKVGDAAFKACTGLTSFEFPESVKEIGGQVLYNCTSLTKIVLYDAIEKIGLHAFISETNSFKSIIEIKEATKEVETGDVATEEVATGDEDKISYVKQYVDAMSDTVVEGETNAPAVEGTDAPEVDGTDAPAVEGTDAPAVEGTDAPAVEGTDAPAVEGTDAPEVDGTDAPEVDGTDAPEVDGTDAPAVEGTDAPVVEGTDAPVMDEFVLDESWPHHANIDWINYEAGMQIGVDTFSATGHSTLGSFNYIIDASATEMNILENATLTLGGWMAVTGGINRYVYSVNGGEWMDAVGGADGEPLPGHYEGSGFTDALKNGMFQANANPVTAIVADLSAYAGQDVDVEFAAVSEADTSKLIPILTIWSYPVPALETPATDVPVEEETVAPVEEETDALGGEDNQQSYTVTYVYYYNNGDQNNSQTLTGEHTETVQHGNAAPNYTPPARNGMTFTGYDADLSNITGDKTVYAQYTVNTAEYIVKRNVRTQAYFDVISSGASMIKEASGYCRKATNYQPLVCDAWTTDSDKKIVMSGWMGANGGQDELVWSVTTNPDVDTTLAWNSCTDGFYHRAEDGVSGVLSGGPAELTSVSLANGRFRGVELDLSAYAGQTINISVGVKCANSSTVVVILCFTNLYVAP